MRFWLALAFQPPHELIPLARAAEGAGYHGVTLSDHLLHPRDLRSPYPYSKDGTPPFDADTPWPDPWVAIAAMAAVTERLRFTTNVYVAAARDVFTVAKTVATAAVLSNGRVALGTAAGWMREEFELTGRDFDRRGRTLDETIQALRLLWWGDFVEFEGDHLRFPSLKISPAPADPIAIYVGGESEAALRRAATLGDGWIGNAQSLEAALLLAARLRTMREREGPFEVIVPLITRPAPDIYRRAEDGGVTGIITRPWRDDATLEAKVAGIAGFTEAVGA
ncbi:MAG: TIGR03619 family F420-dependent LLM class oxidoreductase [Actinomycetota bacterium]